MGRQKEQGHMKAALLIGMAVFFCYFFSEAVLRQFVLHRAGAQSISLASILGKLPPGIRDEVTRQITIAEYKDDLRKAKTVGEKIRISIALANTISQEELQKKYAELLDKYPNRPESLPAYTNYLMAPPTALKSVPIERYQKFIGIFKKQENAWAWSAGLAKLKSLRAANEKQIEFLLPLLKIKPGGREYGQLYRELSELAFQEDNQDIELKAKKLEDFCEKLPYFDEALERRAKAKARKAASAKKKAAEAAKKKKAMEKK